MLHTILVPLDGSALAERALPIACDLARRAGGAVHLIRVHRPVAIVGGTGEGAFVSTQLLAADDQLRAQADAYVAATAARASADWGVEVVPHAEVGTPQVHITETAERIAADLVVMTTHGHGGFTPDWLGSVTDSVIRHSHRAVLALPANDEHAGTPFAPRRILVTLDGSKNGDAILGPARDLALAFGALVNLVRVVSPYAPGDVTGALLAERADAFGVDTDAVHAKAELDDAAHRLEGVGLSVTTTVRVDLSPGRSLLDHIRESDPDCVAIATQGRGVSRVFLGSVADKLIRTARRPVLVLRPAQRLNSSGVTKGAMAYVTSTS